MSQYLTPSLEDYIEIIYILGAGTEPVGMSEVAKVLGISKPSVSRAVRTLKLKSLVIQEKYGKIILTPKGESVAKEIYSKHRMLSEFFMNVLGVSEKVAEIDACKIEHLLSTETLEKIKKILKDKACM